MKRIEAIFKLHKLALVSLALHGCPGVTGVTACDVHGWGHGKLQAEQSRVAEQATDFEPHVRIEIICAADRVGAIAAVIRDAAHTGLAGDGLVVIFTVEDAIRLSTGARRDHAL